MKKTTASQPNRHCSEISGVLTNYIKGKTNENICNKWRNKWEFFSPQFLLVWSTTNMFCVWIINYSNGITIGCNNAGKKSDNTRERLNQRKLFFSIRLEFNFYFMVFNASSIDVIYMIRILKKRDEIKLYSVERHRKSSRKKVVAEKKIKFVAKCEK